MSVNTYDVAFDEGTVTVQPRVQDQLWAEAQFRKHKSWGKVAESPTLFVHLNVFRALQRLELLPPTVASWDEFTEHTISVRPVRDDEPDDDEDDDGPLEVAGLGKDTPADR